MFYRQLESVITVLMQEFRILYLTGPRQAGKTTLTRSIAKTMNLEYISFDDQTIIQSAKKDPVGFIELLGNKKVVLDEFQYIPELISAIKHVSDQLPPHEKGKFLLTGSADIFRSAKTQESLPGHMARLELYPLSLSEKFASTSNIIDRLCSGDFSMPSLKALSRQELATLIIQGGYPEVQEKSMRAKKMWYSSYSEGRLFKDFETLYAARGDYHSKLKALIAYLAGLSGNLLKYANISNDLRQEDKVIKNYIEILELMFFVKRVPGYLKNKAKRQAVTMPKCQLIDTGLACNLLGIQNENQLIQSPHFGALLENLIYLELLKQSGWANESVELYHFRDNHQNEVDIVLERDNDQIIGVEIKASATLAEHDFRGLIKLAEFSASKFQMGVVFYSGKEVLSFSQNGIKLFALPMRILY
ncbi:MAG: AAA family ATPase [Gammaproteobacteria bacterium RIFCSPHIGHO2_12_FULL_40_19]|nr:MAG: AAA family ATPase [Gammaproteobacteria bacterium RIFCSPHIGHO2_12_FULL_40_19]